MMYARGCREWVQFQGFEISIMAVFSLQSTTPGSIFSLIGGTDRRSDVT